MHKLFIVVFCVLTILLFGCSDIIVSKYYYVSTTILLKDEQCHNYLIKTYGNASYTGFKILIKDKDTGEILKDGTATIDVDDLGGGGISNDYACIYVPEQHVNMYGHAKIESYAPGHSPYTFILDYLANKKYDINVYLTKSCNDGPSFFDNINTSAQRFTNNTLANEYIQKQTQSIYNNIDEAYNLNSSDYTLTCVEAQLVRGGYIKAECIYKDGSSFQLFYHQVWCSSGGADCSSNICFNSTSKELLAKLRKDTVVADCISNN